MYLRKVDYLVAESIVVLNISVHLGHKLSKKPSISL